jgi:pyrroline-5-carboxylate reductase
MTYGIVGVGAIAAAIVTGLCEHVPDAPRIVLSPRNAGRVADLAARFPTVRVAGSNQEVLDESSVVLLCIRPQDARSVLPGLKFSAHHAIVSAMAGIQIAALRELVTPAQNIASFHCLPSSRAKVQRRCFRHRRRQGAVRSARNRHRDSA